MILKWTFKCDLAKENLTNNNEQMNEFCQDKGFAGWFETSAKDDINVEKAAKFLVSKVCFYFLKISNSKKIINVNFFKILEKENALRQEEEKLTSDKLTLTNENNNQNKTRCC